MKPHETANHTTRGFTLTELLVVIAIVVLLSAVSFAVIARLKASSARTTSTSNLRNLGTTLMLYSSDHNGAFPPAASTVQSPEGGWAPDGVGSWDGYILPYLFPEQSFNFGNMDSFYDIIKGSSSLFSHPRDKSEISTPKRVRRGYAMPSNTGAIGVATWAGTEIIPSARLVVISAPATTILLTEKPGYSGNSVGRTGGAQLRSPAEQVAQQPDLNGENGRFHYLFADGHVELLRMEDTIGTGSLTLPKGKWTLNAND